MTAEILSGAVRSVLVAAVVSLLLLSGCDSDPSTGLLADRGAGVYLKNCASCHGSDGYSPMAGVPPLVGSDWVVGAHPPLIAMLLDGLGSPGKAAGEGYRGVMPAWRDVLDDQQIADVLNYVRMQSGVKDEEVSPESVARLRQIMEHRHAFWTAEELRESSVLQDGE